jgi:hypothetical protein
MVTFAPTSRWYPLRPHAEQQRLWTSPARFRVAPCGRRSGKSELLKRFAIKVAMTAHNVPDYRVLLGGPTWQQARRVFWRDIQALCPTWALRGQDRRRAISQGEMTVDFINGAQLVVTGLDQPQRAEGAPLDFVGIDESADVKESAWLENIRPGLSERGGRAWLVGTPEGRNWFWQLAQRAQEEQIHHPELWSHHTWPSSDILPPEEIAIARAELDIRTFSQEYEASFLDVTGRVYYGFQRDVHAVERLPYDPKSPLLIGFDFNVAPGVAIICQERLYEGTNPKVDRDSLVAAVIGEVWIPSDSNTGRVCGEIIRRFRSHNAPVEIYGDASGGARGTSQVDGSDLDLIRQHLSPVFDNRLVPQGERLQWFVPRANPSVRARINAVNSRLESASGEVRLLVDPSCKHLIQDLEAVSWAAGRDLDKKSSPMLTHISDALGYLVCERWPLTDRGMVVTQL